MTTMVVAARPQPAHPGQTRPALQPHQQAHLGRARATRSRLDDPLRPSTRSLMTLVLLSRGD
eukprot:SAG11_NODE_5827_length_1454_cov_3.181550_1_plen_62_part_00